MTKALSKRSIAVVSSRGCRSRLVNLFVARSGEGVDARPEEVLASLIQEQVKRLKAAAGPRQLEEFLRLRNILEVEEAPALDCDGYLEPIGQDYRAGFRVKVSRSAASVRRRFTIAHEACHTFFYELVPELKFVPHATDDEEERLCNFGASVLLVPEKDLKKKAKCLPCCIETLRTLAADFGVSIPVMLIRLRGIGIWRLELSIWRRLSNGSFAIESVYGGSRAPWRWMDEGNPRAAWNSSGSVFGRSVLYRRKANGADGIRGVKYQALKIDSQLWVLFGTDLEEPPRDSTKLF